MSSLKPFSLPSCWHQLFPWDKQQVALTVQSSLVSLTWERSQFLCCSIWIWGFWLFFIPCINWKCVLINVHLNTNSLFIAAVLTCQGRKSKGVLMVTDGASLASSITGTLNKIDSLMLFISLVSSLLWKGKIKIKVCWERGTDCAQSLDTDIALCTSCYLHIQESTLKKYTWLQKIQLLQHNLTLIIYHFFLFFNNSQMLTWHHYHVLLHFGLDVTDSPDDLKWST